MLLPTVSSRALWKSNKSQKNGVEPGATDDTTVDSDILFDLRLFVTDRAGRYVFGLDGTVNELVDVSKISRLGRELELPSMPSKETIDSTSLAASKAFRTRERVQTMIDTSPAMKMIIGKLFIYLGRKRLFVTLSDTEECLSRLIACYPEKEDQEKLVNLPELLAKAQTETDVDGLRNGPVGDEDPEVYAGVGTVKVMKA